VTVTYCPNGASGSSIVDNVNPGTYHCIRQNPFSRPGYVFDGWNTTPDGSCVNYGPGMSFYIASSITLYAKWKACPPNQFTVTYYPNGGTGSIKDVRVNANSYYTIESQGYSRSGYIFDCWNTRADGCGINYQVCQTIYVTGNISLYAKWKCK
jgi:uncharacterized repeat protein (TIGR02543 family)